MWLEGLVIVLDPSNLLALGIGTLLGIIIGALPGLGPVFALTLFLPVTFPMSAEMALIFLISLYSGTIYGGSISAILLNAPGTPGSVATCLDGYPLARSGRGGEALVAAAVGSMFGGLLGTVAVVLIAPLVATVALKIDPASYSLLAFLGLSMVAVASHGDTLRGLILGGVGVLLSFVGQDPITGGYRFTMGFAYLEDGVPFPIVAIGLFAVAQCLVFAEEGGKIAQSLDASGGLAAGVWAVLTRWRNVIRSSLIGIGLGAIPGVGISTSNFVAYAAEMRASRDKSGFGKGNIAGVIAPETANNATLPGELIPTLTLGIPGGAGQALLLVAAIVHGVEPGLRFFEQGSIAYAFFIALFLAQVTFAVFGLIGNQWFIRVTLVPVPLLAPAVLAFALVGAFTLRGRWEDLVAVLFWGIAGFVMIRFKYPVAPLVLGLVLGELAERSYRQAALIAEATQTSPYLQPLPLVLSVLVAGMVIWSVIEFFKSPETSEGQGTPSG